MDILLHGVTGDDKKLVSQILFPIQEKHTKLCIESKGKSIEEIYTLVFGKEERIKMLYYFFTPNPLKNV